MLLSNIGARMVMIFGVLWLLSMLNQWQINIALIVLLLTQLGNIGLFLFVTDNVGNKPLVGLIALLDYDSQNFKEEYK